MNGRLKNAGLIAICLILLGSGVVLAQGRGPGDGPHPQGRMGRGLGPMAGLLHELDLTEEQQDQLRATVHEHMGGQLGKLMRESQQTRRQLARLVNDPAADETAIIDAAHRAGLAGEKIALERHRLSVAIGEVLSAEQQQRYQELLAERPRPRPRRRGFPSDN